MAVKGKSPRQLISPKKKRKGAASSRVAPRSNESEEAASLDKSDMRERLTPGLLKFLIEETPIHPAAAKGPKRPPFVLQDD